MIILFLWAEAWCPCGRVVNFPSLLVKFRRSMPFGALYQLAACSTLHADAMISVGKTVVEEDG